MKDIRGNKKANLKVEIYGLLKKHFVNGIWNVNTSLRFWDMASFCNVYVLALSKVNTV